MAPREACVCASFLFWNKEMFEGCVAQSISTLHKVSGRPSFPALVLSRIGWALNLIIILYACFHPNVRKGITSLITSSWFWVFSCSSIPQACLSNCFMSHMPVCVHMRRVLYPAKPRPSSTITTSISPREGEPERQRARGSATAGSEITNSIVLCWMTCLLSNFLRATSEGRKVWRKRGRRGRPPMLPVALIFLCSAANLKLFT